MTRLDQRLVEWSFAPTRTKAQAMIGAGEVEVRTKTGEWKIATQASQKTDGLTREDIRIAGDGQTLKYVSRGGLKLEGALEHLKLSVAGFRCLDVGLSTGGFADCLLQRGAISVAGLDVGHSQLHPNLMADPRVLSWEGLHIKNLGDHGPARAYVDKGVDLCVVDVSFISLELVLPVLGGFLPPRTRLLALVKPQFEVGQEHLSRKGIVNDDTLFADVKARVLLALAKYGFSEEDYFPSRVKGQDGNQEFFIYARRLNT